MRTHYVSCFHDGDPAEPRLTTALAAWPTGRAGRTLTQEKATDGEDLRTRITTLFEAHEVDVLIVGGHGHDSLSGFWVRDDPVRWHDLAFLLRQKVRRPCTFVFYSCNGGYPGSTYALGGASGIDFIFGARIYVYDVAITHATMSILDWREAGQVDPGTAKALVDAENRWGAATYPGTEHDLFLRVMWGEPTERHPATPNPQRPYGPLIPLRGWGLE
jgi:hypothetical protein